MLTRQVAVAVARNARRSRRWPQRCASVQVPASECFRGYHCPGLFSLSSSASWTLNMLQRSGPVKGGGPQRWFASSSGRRFDTTVPPSLRDHAVLQHLQQLAQQQQFPQMLTLVDAMYAPLMERFTDATDPPLAKFRPHGATAVAKAQVQVDSLMMEEQFDENLTKIVEQEAAFLLNRAERYRLTMQIQANRKYWLDMVANAHESLETTTDQVPKHQVQGQEEEQEEQIGSSLLLSGTHLRTFYSAILYAARMTKKYNQTVLTLYDEAVANGIKPTSFMNATYINVLLQTGQFDDVVPFYRKLIDDDAALSTDVFEQMVQFALRIDDLDLMMEIADEVSFKGMRLDDMSYVQMMRAVFYTTTSRSRSSTSSHTNGKKVDRTKDEQLERVHIVLDLFDRLTEADEMPTDDEIYFRAMCAYELLNEYARIPQVMQLHKDHVQVKHDKIQARINQIVMRAFLALDEPVKAFQLIAENLQSSSKYTHTHVDHQSQKLMEQIISYIVETRNGDIKSLMRVLQQFKEMLDPEVIRACLSTSMHHIMVLLGQAMPDDDELVAYLFSEESSILFRHELQRMHSLLLYCLKSNRLDLGMKALQHCKFNGSKPRVGVKFLRKCIEQERFDLIVGCFDYFQLYPDDESVEMFCLMVAACDQLQLAERATQVIEKYRYEPLFKQVPREMLPMIKKYSRPVRAAPSVAMAEPRSSKSHHQASSVQQMPLENSSPRRTNSRFPKKF